MPANFAPRRLPITLALAVTVTACHSPAPAPRTASFRSRPDSVAPGDLRGPFTGRVVDASNQSPIAGAMVYATWSLADPTASEVAAGFVDAVASTDATGHYQIPELPAAKSGARIVDFQLVIYKRSFVAYRSDRRFSDFGPRRDFAQRDNQVELERWRPEYAHARHVRFVGGGAAIAAVTAWETTAAIAELDPAKRDEPRLPASSEGPYIVAAQLLTSDDIKARTRFDGSFETGPLGDEPDTSTYSSQHFKAMGRNETFDVALRLWRLTPAAAIERYDELSSGLPGVEARDEIASRSLRAIENDIYGVGFLDGQRGVVVLLTCGKSQCSSMDDAVVLGKAVHRRIKELWPLGKGGTGGAP